MESPEVEEEDPAEDQFNIYVFHPTSTYLIIYIPLCIVLIEALTGTSSLHLSCN